MKDITMKEKTLIRTRRLLAAADGITTDEAVALLENRRTILFWLGYSQGFLTSKGEVERGISIAKLGGILDGMTLSEVDSDEILDEAIKGITKDSKSELEGD